ncbi:hypothetical protein [Lysobacter enzymogenes]|uniref:hypothetical protein n=1 Tax=Lysobacter enzymogenes TaxID=69 RepID=UPI00089C9BB1|nr:hypothetical protein [Lysobacter enzymogenes]SDW85828.1 hypothetical protein SAMN05421681_10335 [Lysobacter enzymogenes]
MANLSTIAFQVRASLGTSGLKLTHANVLELLAASLGYGTYAALKLDKSIRADEIFTVEDHVVLQSELLLKRLQKLSVDQAGAQVVGEVIWNFFNLAVKEEGGTCRFHASMEDFEDFIFQDVQDRAMVDDDVNDAYNETNAYIDEFYTDSYEYEPLLDADNEWVLVASGSHTGDVDPDRPYSGHTGSFIATYTFQKCGRAGLIEDDPEFGLDFERDYDEE